MDTILVLIVSLGMAEPDGVPGEAYQLWLEVFDESRRETVCAYHSKAGNYKVTKYFGRYLCPRVV